MQAPFHVLVSRFSVGANAQLTVVAKAQLTVGAKA